MSDNFIIEEQNHVSRITINRPEKRNAFTMAMWGEFAGIMRQLRESAQTRAVVIRGAGDQAFCAGIDLTEFAETGASIADPGAWDAIGLEDAMHTITEFPYPVIAMVNGHAIAGGCELALHCDLVLAAEHARFGMPIAKIGLMVPFPLAQRLVHAIGVTHARDLLFTGRLIAAHEARDMGMVHTVTSGEDLPHRVDEMAATIAGNAPLSLMGMKTALARCFASDRSIATDDLRTHMMRCLASADAREGLAAFAERRTPVFTGR